MGTTVILQMSEPAIFSIPTSSGLKLMTIRRVVAVGTLFSISAGALHVSLTWGLTRRCGSAALAFLAIFAFAFALR